MSGRATKQGSLLLAKWCLLGHALRHSQLSMADAAVLWQLCERFSEQSGAAWPSLSTLAKDSGRDRRTVQRCLARLESSGLVSILQRGGRTSSNRYRPTFEAWQLGASTPPHVGAPLSECRGAAVAQLGASTPPESIYEPGYEAGVSKGGPAGACAPSGGEAGAAPGGLPLSPITGRKYPEFWAAYPKQSGVFKAEAVIRSLISNGEVEMQELVAGARAYAAWVQAQPWRDKEKYTKGPANWLEARGWLDDRTVIPKKQPSKDCNEASKASCAAPGTAAGAPHRSASGGRGKPTKIGALPCSPLTSPEVATVLAEVRRRLDAAWGPWRLWHGVRPGAYPKDWVSQARARLNAELGTLWGLIDGPMPEPARTAVVSPEDTARAVLALERERAWLRRMLSERSKRNAQALKDQRTALLSNVAAPGTEPLRTD